MAAPNQILRVVAGIGVGVVLLQEAVTALPLKPRQEYGVAVLVLALVAVAVVFAFLMPGMVGTLLRHKDLLVPLGLLTLAEAVLGWLTLLPVLGAVLAPSTVVKLWVLSFTVSVAFVISILLQVAYGAWTTAMILNTVRHGRSDAVADLYGMALWFLRVFGLEFIGWGVLFAGVACAIALAAAGALPLTLVLIGAGSLLWNLATAAVLPVALDERLRFWEAIRLGMGVSWRGMRRWWSLVVVQMVLLGWITFFAVSYTESKPGSTTTQSKTNFSVNGFWTGGYENECRWYGKLMQTMEAPTVALISTVLTLVFGVLAVAIKLRISEDIMPLTERTYLTETALDTAFSPANPNPLNPA